MPAFPCPPFRLRISFAFVLSKRKNLGHVRWSRRTWLRRDCDCLAQQHGGAGQPAAAAPLEPSALLPLVLPLLAVWDLGRAAGVMQRNIGVSHFPFLLLDPVSPSSLLSRSLTSASVYPSPSEGTLAGPPRIAHSYVTKFFLESLHSSDKLLTPAQHGPAAPEARRAAAG